VKPEQVYVERLYRALDRLPPHKAAIEAHLARRFGELFQFEFDLLLYDVTSTYFEGVGDATIAKRGHSRDHRPDCVHLPAVIGRFRIVAEPDNRRSTTRLQCRAGNTRKYVLNQ
jgi:hypothetical protein